MHLHPEAPGAPHVRLVSFTWNREGRADEIEFTPGFNLIAGESQAERTTILRLIRYAMGGSHDRINTEIMQETKSVALEFLANGKRITTTRDFRHAEGRFAVSIEDEDTTAVNPREMAEFMLERLGIPKVHWESGERVALVSFNEIARAFVVDRDFSYGEILAKVPPGCRREIVKLMLGLTTQEIADVSEEIRQTQSRLQQLSHEIQGVERLLLDFNVRSLPEIEDARGDLLTQLHDVETRELDLRKKMQPTAMPETPEGPGVPGEYQSLSTELAVSRERLSETEADLAALARQIEDKADLKALLESEVRQLERRAASQHVLSTFTFSCCPRCLQPIEEGMRQREGAQLCMLCGRQLLPSEQFDADDWAKALQDARKVVQETEQLLCHYRDRRTASEGERQLIRERVAYIEAQLDRQMVAYVSPLVEDLSLVNEKRTQFVTALSALDLEEKQRRYTQRMQDEVLPELKTREGDLRYHLADLQQKLAQPHERISLFLDHLRGFMRAADSRGFRSAGWDDDGFLPSINEQPHTKALSGPDLIICVLAFHYSLLAMKVTPPGACTCHPGLLVVDEPEQQLIADYQHRSIMRLFERLGEDYPLDAQIVVAATDTAGFESYTRPITATRDRSDRAA